MEGTLASLDQTAQWCTLRAIAWVDRPYRGEFVAGDAPPAACKPVTAQLLQKGLPVRPPVGPLTIEAQLFFVESAAVLAEAPALNGCGFPLHAADNEIAPKGHGMNTVEFAGLRGVVGMRVDKFKNIQSFIFGGSFGVE